MVHSLKACWTNKYRYLIPIFFLFWNDIRIPDTFYYQNQETLHSEWFTGTVRTFQFSSWFDGESHKTISHSHDCFTVNSITKCPETSKPSMLPERYGPQLCYLHYTNIGDSRVMDSSLPLWSLTPAPAQCGLSVSGMLHQSACQAYEYWEEWEAATTACGEAAQGTCIIQGGFGRTPDWACNAMQNHPTGQWLAGDKKAPGPALRVGTHDRTANHKRKQRQLNSA